MIAIREMGHGEGGSGGGDSRGDEGLLLSVQIVRMEGGYRLGCSRRGSIEKHRVISTSNTGALGSTGDFECPMVIFDRFRPPRRLIEEQAQQERPISENATGAEMGNISSRGTSFSLSLS
jgi:hypothetical protein